MSVAQASVIISLPIESVFAFVANPRNDSRWQPAFIRHEGLSDAPIVPGSSWLEVRRVGSREVTIKVFVREFDPPNSFSWHGDGGILQVEGHFAFERGENGTRVTERMDFRGRGFLGLLSGVIAARNQGAMQDSLEQLSREIMAG